MRFSNTNHITLQKVESDPAVTLHFPLYHDDELGLDMDCFSDCHIENELDNDCQSDEEIIHDATVHCYKELEMCLNECEYVTFDMMSLFLRNADVTKRCA